MIEVTIPQFIQEYKLSNKIMRRFYKEGSKIPLPLTYSKNPTRFIYKKGKLFDVEKKEFITRNKNTVGKPRMKAISANNIWSKMDEHERMKMVEQVKASFKPYFEAKAEAFKHLKYPIIVEWDIYTPPRYGDWDLTNIWVYSKVMEDLIKTDDPAELAYLTEKNPNRIPGLGLIPDDCIFYITKAASPQFIPVQFEQERCMVFRFIEDKRPEIINHLMYNLQPKLALHFVEGEEHHTGINFLFTKEGSTGNYIFNTDEWTITANVGKKKVISGEVSAALNRLYWDCINLNQGIIIPEEQFKDFESYIVKFLLERGIPVYVRRTTQDGAGQTAS